MVLSISRCFSLFPISCYNIIHIYAYLLSIEPSNLVFLKTYNTQFDEIIITFTDENGRPLEMEDEVNLTLVINKQKRLALPT